MPEGRQLGIATVERQFIQHLYGVTVNKCMQAGRSLRYISELRVSVV
jgi:hypothetical protein